MNHFVVSNGTIRSACGMYARDSGMVLHRRLKNEAISQVSVSDC